MQSGLQRNREREEIEMLFFTERTPTQLSEKFIGLTREIDRNNSKGLGDLILKRSSSFRGENITSRKINGSHFPCRCKSMRTAHS